MSEKTILVVEDERPLREAILKKLTVSGFTVVSATTVAEALTRMEENDIKAIWLDHYLLGQEDGLDFVQKIKDEASAWKAVPVFVVSNTASADKVQTYLQLGVNNYYTKAKHKLEDIIADITAAVEE